MDQANANGTMKVLLLLADDQSRSLAIIADAIGYANEPVQNILRNMRKRKYIDSSFGVPVEYSLTDIGVLRLAELRTIEDRAKHAAERLVLTEKARVAAAEAKRLAAELKAATAKKPGWPKGKPRKTEEEHRAKAHALEAIAAARKAALQAAQDAARAAQVARFLLLAPEERGSDLEQFERNESMVARAMRTQPNSVFALASAGEA